MSPLIAPFDSFGARLAPPNAGTFIYHRYCQEYRQQGAELAGAFIVVEPGAHLDHALHHLLLVTSPLDLNKALRVVLFHGSATLSPTTVRAGQGTRLAMINMTFRRSRVRVRIIQGYSLVPWRMLAQEWR